MAQAAATTSEKKEERLATQGLLAKQLTRPEVGALIGAFGVYLIFAIFADGFAGFGGFARYTDQASHIGIMATFVAFLMIGGEFDLSSGIMTGSAGLSFTMLATPEPTGFDLPIWVALLGSLLLAIAVGLFNGYMVTKTKLGNWIQAIGGDSEAARGVGVPVDRVKIGLFVATSMGAWLVGLIQAFENNGVTSVAGRQQEFIYIIAAVIGGCLLTGGYGSIIGAAIGALVFGMTRTGVTFAGWETDWFWTFMGVMLLLAVVINNFVSTQAKKVRAK